MDIVVNATLYETRVALLEQQRVVELFVERHKDQGLVGHIYQGRVTKIVPGMQAAFVDIGLAKAGFLHVSDILAKSMPEDGGEPREAWGTPPPSTLDGSVPSILEVIDEGQEILVQVTKEPLGTKGCRLTSWMSLAGRYLVLTPGVEHIGVSRRITLEEEKERLRTCVQPFVPPGMGCIVRTLSAGVAVEELQEDLQFLLALWRHVQDTAAQRAAPCLVHQERDLVLRTIRDYFSEDVERFILDDAPTYARAEAFLQQRGLTHLAARLSLYQGTTSLFDVYNVERDIARALQRKVWLKSGGYISIDPTEALVAIDVNTGRFVSQHDQAMTMLTTNLEAVHEIARQLRLRNIGGLVVIDFIDMDTAEHRQQICNTLELCLQADRAHTRVLPMSEFGVVEMTRKRVRASLDQLLCAPCPTCHGTGRLESVAAGCAKVMREIQRVMQNTPHTKKVLINVEPGVAEALRAEEQSYLTALEYQYGTTLVLQADNAMQHGQCEVLPL